MYGTVQVASTTTLPISNTKIRLYYPVKNLEGPECKIVNNYDEYVLYYGEDDLALFLFNRGYQLFCNRVSNIVSYSNCTKYSNGKYLQDTNRYIETRLVYDVSKSTYTYHVYFNVNAVNHNNFYIYVRKNMIDLTSLISDDYIAYSIGLFGYDYIKSRGDGDWNLGRSDILNDFRLSPTSGHSVFLRDLEVEESTAVQRVITIEELEGIVISFLKSNCTLDVVDLGFHHYLISSNSPDLQIYCNTDLLQIVDKSMDYYYRVNSYLNKDKRVLSISSKYPSSVSNIKVNISEGNFNRYKIHVYKSTTNYTNEEYYEVTKDEINSIQSNIVEFNLIDPSEDITGTYELIGSPGYYSDLYFEDYLSKFNVIENDYPQVDIFLDTSGSSVVPSLTRANYPNALIFTNNVQSGNSILSISPKYITWLSNRLTTPSNFLVLDLLPDSIGLFSKSYISPNWDDSDNENSITETSYEYVFTNLHVIINDTLYSIKLALARAMIYRMFTEVYGGSVDEIHNMIDNDLNGIEALLKVNLNYEFLSESQIGTKYTANIRVSMDNQIFENFNINVEVNYNAS